MYKQTVPISSRSLRYQYYSCIFYGTQVQATENCARLVEADTCISLIKQCKTLQSLKCVHSSMLRSHLHLNIFFSTNLIAHYASLGSVSHAYSIFWALSSLDVFVWNVMVRGFVDNGLYDRALLLYKQMLQFGVSPDNYTFPFVVKACGYVGDFELGSRLHGHVVAFGYHSDVFVGNSLVAVYGKFGRVDTACNMFEKMPQRNEVSWSSIIGAYAQNGCCEVGRLLFVQMLNEGILPNRAAILNAMACVSTENDAEELCRVVRENKLDSYLTVKNATMQMYARCGRIDIARRFFDRMSNKDLVCWTSMIEAYVQADLPLRALELFKQMVVQGVPLDSVTLLSVMQAGASIASFQQARFIHGHILRRSFKSQVELETALIVLHVKCGSLDYARKIFDRMEERNVISWSTMISGYGTHGCGRDAIGLFNQMKLVLKPDHVSFLSVLSACSHGGLVAEGWECFKSMIIDFQIEPKPEHYACMVDLLGRSGRIEEAFDFIQTMPIRPDAGVWGALLGACRIHSNIELGKVAAENLFKLDKENSGRYILMSNVYASFGKPKDADRIRDQMKQKGVRKNFGHAIIEIGN